MKSISVNLLPGPLSRAASSIEGATTATAGAVVNFLLQLRDAFSNPETDSFGAVPSAAVLDGAGQTVSGAVTAMSYLGQGRFSLAVHLTASARYGLQVTLDGTPALGSPLQLRVGPAAKNAQASRVQLNQSVVAGVGSVVWVQAVDR